MHVHTPSFSFHRPMLRIVIVCDSVSSSDVFYRSDAVHFFLLSLARRQHVPFRPWF